ncbi:MAG TPA: hypothetical protein VGI81_19395 [Tepidisphaeraceae bacterium]|jgi:hypothetical protein
MRKAWFILAGFMLGVVLTATVGPRFGAVATPNGQHHVTMAERALDRVVAQIDLSAVPFDRAVDDVRKLTSAKVEVDDAALAEASFDRTTPITMHGTEIPLGRIPERLTAPGDATGAQLGFCVMDGRIVITTEAKLESHRTVRIYDVRDVLRSSMLTPDPDGAPVVNDGPPPPPGPDDQSRAESLIRLIEDTVATDSWKDNGGSAGAMHYCGFC